MSSQDPTNAGWRRYRARNGNARISACQMLEAFKVKVKGGRIDQRKAGAKKIVEYVSFPEGKAGDYLVIWDEDTGHRDVCNREVFERAFDLAEPAEG